MDEVQIKAMVKGLLEEALGKLGAEGLLRQMATGTPGAAPAVKAQSSTKTMEEKSLQVARIIRALAAGRGDVERAAAHAKKAWGDDEVAKALTASENTGGGFLLQEELATSIIELLRPASVIRRMNPVIIPMASGSVLIPKMTGGASAGYIGEGSDIPATAEVFGQVPLVWKKLGALVPISNDLLRFSSFGVDTMVRDDLVAAMGQKSDWAFIRGAGTSFTPKGLLNWCLAAQSRAMTGSPDLAKVTTDLLKLVLDLYTSNGRMLRPGWLFAPRTMVYLMSLRDGNGNFAFKPEMDGGKLFGFPFATTTQIPINLSTNQSEIYLVDFADVVIGEAQTLILEVSTEASYSDGSNLVSAFSKDQTVIKAIQHHDLAIRHLESISMLTGVTWGT